MKKKQKKFPLTMDERKRLLHEYHWPKAEFPDKKYSGGGTEMECDYYHIPKHKMGV